MATDQTSSGNRLAPYGGESGNSGAGSDGGSDDRSDGVPCVRRRAARGRTVLRCVRFPDRTGYRPRILTIG